jgi:hypothetical protein
MKKFALLFVALFAVLTLSACGDTSLCVGPECLGEIDAGNNDTDDNNDNNTGDSGTTADNVITFTHLNGHGEETEKLAYILFEVEVRDYVKYQVAFLACTCRDKVVNYWNVMYLEINKYTGDVRTLTFDTDGESGHYTPGTWGDSSGDPNQNGITYDQFKADFFPWVVGQTADSLADISMLTDITGATTTDGTDLVDAFAGSSVSTNNIIRVVKEMLEYHATKYD